MAHIQNKYGAANSTDAYGNVISKDEYGNVIPTDEYGNPIRHSSTTLQSGQQQQQQQQRHNDLSTEYDGQGGGRNKGLKDNLTENIWPGVGNNDHRNDTSSATTDAYGNVIRKDEYGNVIPTDEYGNPIRHSGTTHQGGQQQRHDLSTEYDGQGGRRNKGLKEKIKENIPGVGNNDHRNDISSKTTDENGNVIRKDEYGNVIPTDEYGNPIRHSGTTHQGGRQQQQQQQRHHNLSPEYDGQGGRRNQGLKEKITENIPGVGNNDHRNDTSSATTDAYGNVIRKDEYGNVIPTDEYGNPIRHSGTTHHGGQQQQQSHDLSTEYDGQGGGRNKGLKEKLTENIRPGVGNNDHRNDTSSATTDAYGDVIRKDEYGNVIPTDEYGNPIRHSGTTHQGGQQQQQSHDLSTEYDGQGGGRNKGLKEKLTENIRPGVGNNDHRNDTSSATTDAYGNVIRKDEYGNVIPTDEYSNPIRHSDTTHQGGQQQRHDLSTEYDGQGGGRNKGLKDKLTENIRPGVGNNDHRNDTSSATTDAYGNVIRKDEYGNPIRHSGTTHQGGQQQQQQRHDLSAEYDGQGGRRNKGLKEKVTENIPGVGNKDHRNDTSSATTTAPTTTAGGYGTGEQAQHHQPAEKKGVMEKIKEKVHRCV